MAGPKNKRKRPESDVTLRRQKRDTSAATADDNEKNTDEAEKGPSSRQNSPMEVDSGNDHAEPSSNEAKQPQSEQIQNDASVETHPSRQQRIESILSHRKLLLERLRQSSQAARTQLASVLKSDPASASQSDDQEISGFAEICRQATSLARKQSASGNDSGEKRTSVSLRKGSSVGKRMNAALSSLSSSAGQLGQEDSQSVTQHAASQRQGTVAATPANTERGSAQGRASQQKRPQSRTAPLAPPNLLDSPSITARQNLAPVQKVICPEAIELRTRRNEIRSKLLHLAKMRKSAQMAQTQRMSIQHLPPLSREERKAAFHGPAPPFRQPDRRKTHWDTLLQEMKWMATDFREERKWKRSAGRILGHSLTVRDKAMIVKKTETAEPPSETKGTKERSQGTGSNGDTGHPTEQEVENASLSSDKGPNGRYTEILSEDDYRSARNASRILSSMIQELSVASVRNTPEAFTTGLEKHKATRKRIEAKEKEEDDSNQSLDDADGTKEDDGGSNDPAENFDGPEESTPAPTFTEISEFIEATHGRLKDLPEYKHKTANVKIKGHDMELTVLQAKVTSDIEGRLSEQCGAVLKGSLATGKTMTVCTMLWKKRQAGPQLVVCSPERVIRWLHELERFDEVECRCVGYDAGIGTTQIEADDDGPYESNDVVVCEFGALHKLKGCSPSLFQTVVVDGRFPDGFIGSRAPVANEDGKQDAFSAASQVPTELRTVSWWSRLAVLARGCLNRLLIQGGNPFGFHRHLQGLPERQLLEVLALRVAFLYDGSRFQSKSFSLEKNILAWSRKHIKRTANERPVFGRMLVLLEDLVKPLVCQLGEISRVEEFETEASGTACWELRQAEMPELQRLAYERACKEQGSLLSSSEKDPSQLDKCAQALMDLRRKCFHADTAAALRSIPSDLCNFSLVMARPNLGQPKVHTALQILRGSGKLKTLLEILSTDTAVVSDGLTELQRTVGGSDPEQKSEYAESADRVLILASLPESQLLVSILLQALGIDHDVLVRRIGAKDAIENDDHRRSTLAWNEAQLALSDFNDPDVEDEVKVIVCSPLTIAGDHGGLGGELADVIISLDEDWSGRGELIQKALVARNTYYEKAFKDDACVFLKIVTSDTCEEVFLDCEPSDGSDLTTGDWPEMVTPLGEFAGRRTTLAVNERLTPRAAKKGFFTFPGRNICSKGKRDLRGVLAAPPTTSQSFFQSSLTPFLPLLDGSSTDLGLTRALLKVEDVECKGPFAVSITPPLPVNHVAMIVSRQDFPALSSRNVALQVSTSQLVGYPDETVEEVAAPEKTGDTYVGEMEEDTSLEVATKESAPSLLFYGCDTNAQATEFRRNAYAAGHSSLKRSLCDVEKNPISEPLVYFPPVFPRMRQCGLQASYAVENTKATRRMSEAGASVSVAAATAEPESEPSDGSTAKRPRVANGTFVTEDEASHSDAASVLLDLSDDYGLAGIGAIPFPRDSAIFAGNIQNDATSSHAGTGVGWNSSLWPSDFAESEELRQTNCANDPNAVVLLVSRKRHRTEYGNMQHILGAQKLPASLWSNGVHVRPDGKHSSGVSSQANRDLQRSRLLTSTRQSGSGSTMFEAPSFRAASLRLRNRVSDRLVRHCWQSSTAFEVGPGLPLLVSKQHAIPATPGYRNLLSADPSLWTSIVKRLKNRNSVTGDEAIEVAAAQHNSFRRSLNAPCRVDFGPFQSGFLASTSGMTSVAPPRPRPGVSLPMGVKTLQPGRDQDVPWSNLEDENLKKSIIRYGSNWTLAGRRLSGFQDIAVFSKQASAKRQMPRAARSCRDRWQALIRATPALAQEARQSERSQRENSALTYDNILDHKEEATVFGAIDGNLVSKTDLDENSEALLAHASWLKSEPEEESKDTSSSTVPRRSFSAFKASKLKKEKVPVSIPGFPPGTTAVVPSHASHMQSVQSSVAAKWTATRKDMWPLQLLDLADRQRAPGTRPSPSVSTSRSGQTSTGKSAASGASSSRSGSAATVQTSHRSVSQQHPPPAVAGGYQTSHSAQRTAAPAVGPPLPQRVATSQSFAPPTDNSNRPPEERRK